MRGVNRHKLPALLASFASTLLWGLSFIGSKYALDAGVPPLTLAFLRYVMLTPLVALMAFIKSAKGLRITIGDFVRILPSAVFGITAYYYFEYSGMLYTSASIASVTLAGIPILTALTESVMNKLRIARPVWLGLMLSAGGVALVVYAPGGVGTPYGYVMLLLTCIAWVAYVMSVRGVAARIEPLPLLAWQSIIALVTLAPLALVERARWVPLTPDIWATAALLAFICSGACYLMYNYALMKLGSVITSSMLNIMPIVSVIAGALLLGERMAPLQLAGGAVIIAATLLVIYKQRSDDIGGG